MENAIFQMNSLLQGEGLIRKYQLIFSAVKIYPMNGKVLRKEYLEWGS